MTADTLVSSIHRLPVRVLGLALAVFSFQSQAEIPGQWQGHAEIEFSGTSTLHEWSGKVAAQPFVATVVTDAAGKPSHLEATVQVKVAGMDTAEPDRDKNLRKSMDAAAFPLITGTINAPFTEIMDARSQQPATLPMKLELLGLKHSVTARITDWKATDRTASFDLDFELSLKDCGVTVPTVLLFIRVGDTIKLHGTAKLVRTTP